MESRCTSGKHRIEETHLFLLSDGTRSIACEHTKWVPLHTSCGVCLSVCVCMH